ncbi:DUF695 domain-containing protein [Silvimonas iriomotensis]|uniref:DUF695 domain-containing protein n=1 Tax=Silvimonas iriomotensis TaxID=449662 RepID=A0ABQ2P785_9NEIS|nr:DUF695 domain-containing protein [Silvimonas iriomotensis]GGP19375.1 hypothetical protein GCM10010970_10300 [Silvimonas iriomotensis]
MGQYAAGLHEKPRITKAIMTKFRRWWLPIVCCLGLFGVPYVHADSKEAWAVATATRPSDGHKIIYRYRATFGPGFSKSQYPERITVSWLYPTTSGMPSHDDSIAMGQMEDLLAPVTDTGSLSYLALVTTGEGVREWVFYAKSRTQFMQQLNAALQGHPRFPVEIDLQSDPKWTRYEEIVGRMAKGS